VNPGIGKGRVARHMVLMSVTVDDGVNWQPNPAGCGDGDRWVDDHRLGGAGDQQRVSRRVRAARLTGEQGDGISKLPNALMMPRKRSLGRRGAARSTCGCSRR
jgi:hypothetical protein